MVVFCSVIVDYNVVFSGFMLLIVMVGDCILVDKLVYDLCLLFIYISLLCLGELQCGDIVIIDLWQVGELLFKCIIGLLGDVVELCDNVFFINGQFVSYGLVYVCFESGDGVDQVCYCDEKLDGMNYLVCLFEVYFSLYSSFGLVVVLVDYYMMLGDNWDNSMDLCYFGFFVCSELMGCICCIVFFLDVDQFYKLCLECFGCFLDVVMMQ